MAVNDFLKIKVKNNLSSSESWPSKASVNSHFKLEEWHSDIIKVPY